MFEKMIVAIGDSVSNLASSDQGEDEEDTDDEEMEQGKVSEVDKPGWVMGKNSRMVQQRMMRFRQKQMKLDNLTQPGWRDAADYFRERDKKHGVSELQLPAVFHPQMDVEVAAPTPTTFGQLTECVNIATGISEMPQGTSRPGRSHIRRGSVMPQVDRGIAGLATTVDPDSSPIHNAKPVELVSCYPCIVPHQPITI